MKGLPCSVFLLDCFVSSTSKTKLPTEYKYFMVEGREGNWGEDWGETVPGDALETGDTVSTLSTSASLVRAQSYLFKNPPNQHPSLAYINIDTSPLFMTNKLSYPHVLPTIPLLQRWEISFEKEKNRKDLCVFYFTSCLTDLFLVILREMQPAIASIVVSRV